MRIRYLATSGMLIAAVLALGVVNALAEGDPPDPHAAMTEYTGPETCGACHMTAAQEVVESLHYQQQGPAPFREDWDGAVLDGMYVTYCAPPVSVAEINWLEILQPEDESLPLQPGGCAFYHPGLGAIPNYPPMEADRQNVDCLICHSPGYERTVAKDEEGPAYFVPSEDLNILEVAQSAQQPTNEMCSRCHLPAAGGPNYKSGDYPISPDVDVHLASGIQCLDCHTAQDHKIAGGGSTIAQELPEVTVACENCHTEQPHDSDTAAMLNMHGDRVACQTCHIPSIARNPDYPTQMTRDYTEPVYNKADGLYGPQVTEASDVIPTYLWWDGQSMETPSQPSGSKDDPGAKITPWKPLEVTVPVDSETKEPIYIKRGVYKIQGDLEAAVNSGVQAFGQEYSGSWEGVTELMVFNVNHQVAPAAKALQCGHCHSEVGQLDFFALGYDEATATRLASMAAPPSPVEEEAEAEAPEQPADEEEATVEGEAVPGLLTFPIDAYQGPETCGQCHDDRHTRWHSGPHAYAYSDPIFQESWESQNKPKYCLACHTTGFDPNTGEFAFEGVTCEQCHEPYSENHPPERVPVDRTGAICGTCHTVSYDEWERSVHHQVGADCLACHEVCTLETHEAGEGVAGEHPVQGIVCANCHHMVADEFMHTTHADAGVDCLTCHMQIGEDDIGPEGKIRTAHDFAVKPSACVDCHADAIHGGNQIIALRDEVDDLHNLLPTGIVEEAEGLRAEVEDLKNVATGRLWQGGFIGALVGLTMGAAAAWLWRRRVE